jgi:hypothetical protein
VQTRRGATSPDRRAHETFVSPIAFAALVTVASGQARAVKELVSLARSYPGDTEFAAFLKSGSEKGSRVVAQAGIRNTH